MSPSMCVNLPISLKLSPKAYFKVYIYVEVRIPAVLILQYVSSRSLSIALLVCVQLFLQGLLEVRGHLHIDTLKLKLCPISMGYTPKAGLLSDLFNRAPKARGE